MKRNLRLFIVLFMMLLILTGCAKEGGTNFTGSNTAAGTNNSSNNSNNVPTSAELSKNIITTGAVAKNGRLIVLVTNKNKVSVDMEIEVEFYDANGIIVGSGENELEGVGAKSEIAVEIYDTPENWDNYKVYVDVESSSVVSYFDKLTITHSNSNKNIAVQVTNNSEDTIEYIRVAVLYYQGDQVVGISDGSEYDIKPGRSANYNIDYAYDKNYDDVRFDSYKVLIIEAYTYNW